MRHIFTLLAMTVMANSLGAVTGEEDAVLRTKLKQHELNKERLSAEDPLSGIEAFVELDHVQPDLSEGIVFLVDIVNDGHEGVDLMDPSELVNIYLRNDEGWICNRGPVSLSFLIKTGDREGTRRWLDARRAFVIEKDGVDRRIFKTVHDIEDATIRLEAGETLRLLLRIEKIVANAREYRLKRNQYTREHNPRSPDFKEPDLRMARPEATIIPIRPGTYKLSVGVSLIRKGSTIGKSLDSDKVTVRLGPPSDEPD